MVVIQTDNRWCVNSLTISSMELLLVCGPDLSEDIIQTGEAGAFRPARLIPPTCLSAGLYRCRKLYINDSSPNFSTKSKNTYINLGDI